MNDLELIAAVAEKMGWVRRMDWDWLDHWKAPDRKRYSVVELPTTDQCLALLDKGQNAKIEYYPHHSFVEIEDVEHDDPIAKADDKFLPRAILLALLEVK